MVISRRCEEAARSVAPLFTERMRRSRKVAPHPTTASIQVTPELSARDASKSPVTKSASLVPFITVPAFLLLVMATDEMLAPPSDRYPGPPHRLPFGRRFSMGG